MHKISALTRYIKYANNYIVSVPSWVAITLKIARRRRLSQEKKDPPRSSRKRGLR